MSMPLYEYKCQSCGRRFERIERASSLHDGVCPKCGGAAHRLLSAPALQFKGSGWYVNDYAKGSASQAPESNHDTAAAPAPKDEKNDSKSDGKSDTSNDTKKDAPKTTTPKVA
jgi:putative FmdB family regulatory protein